MNITLTGNKITQDTKFLAFEKNNNVDVRLNSEVLNIEYLNDEEKFLVTTENEEFKFMRIEFKEIIGGNLDFTLLDPLLSKNYVEKIVDANDKLLKRAGNYRYESLRTIENKYTLCIVKDDFIQNNRYLFTILGDDCEYYGLITTSHTDKNFINMIADAFSAKINNVDNAYNNYTINSDFKIKKYKNSNVLENGFATGTPKAWPIVLNEDNFHLFDGVFFKVDTVSEKSKKTFMPDGKKPRCKSR